MLISNLLTITDPVSMFRLSASCHVGMTKVNTLDRPEDVTNLLTNTDLIVAALVIDNGSGMCKAGFAGDDAPRAVFP